MICQFSAQKRKCRIVVNLGSCSVSVTLHNSCDMSTRVSLQYHILACSPDVGTVMQGPLVAVGTLSACQALANAAVTT